MHEIGYNKIPTSSYRPPMLKKDFFEKPKKSELDEPLLTSELEGKPNQNAPLVYLYFLLKLLDFISKINGIFYCTRKS